jgi:hypothetical protein
MFRIYFRKYRHVHQGIGVNKKEILFSYFIFFHFVQFFSFILNFLFFVYYFFQIKRKYFD